MKIDHNVKHTIYKLTMPGAWSWCGGTHTFPIKNYRLRAVQFKNVFPKHIKAGGMHKFLNSDWGIIICN